MNRFLPILLFLIPSISWALSLDEQLKMVIEVNSLKPSTCVPHEIHVDEKLSSIGEKFFNLKSLSGDGDTSCATCHLESKHLADGLPIGIGVGGGELEGADRLYSHGVVVPRNVFTLFGRTHKDFKIFFWDGKVIESEKGITSPIGIDGFKSPLAIAASLPPLSRDEFLGVQGSFFNNKHFESVNPGYYADRMKAFNKSFNELLMSSNLGDVKELKDALVNNGYSLKDVDLAFIGNSIASFLANNELTKCKPSKWEVYLDGETKSLTESEKRGALVFFGKGRCASCHSGPLFSDFQFHSIGVPQGEFGTHMHRQDLGLAEVTFRDGDRFKFRTPPLIGVSKTAPYGHNGEFTSLEEIVLFHINPVGYLSDRGWTSKREFLGYGKILNSRDKRLSYIDIDSEEELKNLILFLKTL